MADNLCSERGQSMTSGSKWAGFTKVELDAIRDGLLGETEIDPREDPSFPQRVAVAGLLILEIDQHLEQL